ncbi:MAG TPA: PDZ domain-containing protein, partial [Candidatus Absconditabacterales bacterium]|nr:PDZ domain-containing protein [Candidatus Absconditabacterales bacterium]
GQTVFVLKYDPENQETIIKMGIINSKNQKFKIDDNRTYVGFLQTSTAIEPGFSGGPLLDIYGEVIGINTAIDNIEYGASYSLPINQEFVNQTISSIKESGKIIRPYIGIKYEMNSLGLLITEVEENSPAQDAGLQIGDIIYGINDIPTSYNNFLYQLYTYKVDKEIVLNIKRGDFNEDLQIKLGIKENSQKTD